MSSHARKTAEVDSRELLVHFSPEMMSAFSDLAAAVHFSEHFDGDILSIVEGWAAGKDATVYGVLIALPSIAEETFGHVHATGDKRAAEAWREISLKMPEKGFSLAQERRRGK